MGLGHVPDQERHALLSEAAISAPAHIDTHDPSLAASAIGTVLDGRYRLDAVLGEGGMGAVYRALHLAMNRRVAVKVLKPHLTYDDAALRRFAREARGTFKVESPHAVKVLDYGVTERRDYYIVLEYLDGRTVQRELEVDGAFAPDRVVHIARQVLTALAAAHRVGLVHRDLKPDNILLMREDGDPDYAKVLDFGVAKLMANSRSPALSALALTQVGTVFGTPAFMSPEQACGQTLDGRSDLYALAATMVTMLTGRPLFTGERTIDLLTHHATSAPPHLAELAPELVDQVELDALLQRCLAKQRDARPATAEAMASELADIAPRSTAPAESTPHPPRGHGELTSQYVHALLPAPIDPPTETIATPTTTTTTAALRAIRRGRARVAWFAAGSVVAVTMIAAAIALVGRSRTSPRPSLSAHVMTSITSDAAPAPPTAIVRSQAPTGDAGTIVDAQALASPATHGSPDAGRATPPPRHDRIAAPTRNPDLELHLRNAEDGRRAGNHLRELSEADLALRIDPTNSRAVFLVGEVLLGDGNLDGFCKYLHKLGKSPVAVERARTAGCP